MVIYTKKCVICGSPDIDSAGGHVVRPYTYIGRSEYVNLVVIASMCSEHKNHPSINEDTGYYGDYQEWMGMCDDPFNQSKDDIFDLQSQLATVCDLLNSWAREQNVEECQDPYKNYSLRNLVDRLWARTSEKYFLLRDKIEFMKDRLNEY